MPSGDTITLQMLGEMRSGLYPYDNDEEWVQTYLTEAPKGRGDFTTQELLAVSFKHPLNFAPGTELEYSNTNTLPLGMVVEKVSGLSLADYFQQHIFTL